MTVDYLGSILKLVLIDLVLSGDNAVVIGLAAHLLPPRHRRKAMLWGCGLAILMRVSLTLVVAQLLLLPGLRLAGGLMLVWIAAKLLQEGAEAEEHPDESPTTLMKAVVRIAMADFIMSLDNVLAIAGASDSDPTRVMIGLVLSISMLLLLSALIMEIMSRYRWIAFLGAAVLAWTAADMMAKDLSLMTGGDGHEGTGAFPAWAGWLLRVGVVALCLSVNLWLPRKPAVATTGRTGDEGTERTQGDVDKPEGKEADGRAKAGPPSAPRSGRNGSSVTASSSPAPLRVSAD